MSTAVLVKANGEVSHIEIPREDGGWRVIKDAVGGVMDTVANEELGIHAYVHDTGIIDRLRPNVIASVLFNCVLVGDVVISSSDEEGYEITPPDEFLTDEFARHANRLNTHEDAVNDLAIARDEIAKEPFRIIGFDTK